MRPMEIASDRYICTDISSRSLEQFEQFQKKHANCDVTKVSSNCNNCALHDVNFVVVHTSACNNIYRLASLSCSYSTLSWV